MSLRPLAVRLAIAVAGVATFVVVDLVLQGAWAAARQAPAAVTEPTAVPVVLAIDSLAPRIAAGRVAVGLPAAGWEALLGTLQPGSRLNVVASVPASEDQRSHTAVLVHGASVLRPAGESGVLLIEVDGSDGILLAHLVLGGTRLGYVVWPADGEPPLVEAVDEQTARVLLGIAPRATAVPTRAPPATATPVPTPVPTPVVVPTAVPSTPAPTPAPLVVAVDPPVAAAQPPGDRYEVLAGDTLDTIAAALAVDPGALWWANRQLARPDYLVPGMQLVVPTYRGFIYQVVNRDTWIGLSARFGLSAAYLRSWNEMSDDAPLLAGTPLFVPLPP